MITGHSSKVSLSIGRLLKKVVQLLHQTSEPLCKRENVTSDMNACDDSIHPAHIHSLIKICKL